MFRGNWRFWRRRSSLAGVRVIVYSRSNCPLCEKAAVFLEAERRKLGFALEFVDIVPEAQLMRRFGEWVPVVEVAGKVRFRGAVNPVLWRRLMAGLQAGQNESEIQT
ncbi:MAG: glutaredoxin family protein [Gemmataceae bacterium]